MLAPESQGGGMGFLQNLRDDIVFVRGALRALKMTTPIAKNPTRVFPLVIEELAAKYGDAPALISDREQFSYRSLAARSNRYARWALQQGIAKGDTVCLLMPNRPEYMAIWIGITSVGGVVRADQHQSGRPIAGALHRHRGAEAHHRGRRACRGRSRPRGR